MSSDGKFRIGQLAELAGTTIRNVRAYQDRGLLAPPIRCGRVAYYDVSHVDRLRLITALLARGYTLANISELLSSWERNDDVASLIGTSSIFGASWQTTDGEVASIEELTEVFGTPPNASQVAAAVSLGLIEPVDSGFRLPGDRTLDAARNLAELGVSLDQILSEAQELRSDIDRIAQRFIDLAAGILFERADGDTARTPASPEELRDLADALYPLARSVVDDELVAAIRRKILDRVQALFSSVQIT